MAESRTPPKPFPGPLSAVLLTVVGYWTPFFWWELTKQWVEPLVALAFAWTLGYGLVGLLALNQVPRPRRGRLGLVWPRWLHLLPVVLLIPGLFLGMEAQALVRRFFGRPPSAGVYEWSHRILVVDSGLALLKAVFFFGIVMPLVVEWFFRGLIQQGLTERLGRFAGVLLTALLYAVASAGISGTRAGWLAITASSLVLGLLLGWLRAATGSLLCPVLLHVGQNLLWLRMVTQARSLPVPACTAPGFHVPPVLLLPALLSVALAAALLLREQRRAAAPAPASTPG
jgi:membrane protease YdiL (CAAX protease family)